MINHWLNIRLFGWHLIWDYGKWYPKIIYNDYHQEIGWANGYFRIYNLKWPVRK